MTDMSIQDEWLETMREERCLGGRADDGNPKPHHTTGDAMIELRNAALYRPVSSDRYRLKRDQCDRQQHENGASKIGTQHLQKALGCDRCPLSQRMAT